MRLTETSQAEYISAKPDMWVFVAKSTWAENLLKKLDFVLLFYNRYHKVTCVCDRKHLEKMRMYNNRDDFSIYEYSSGTTETSDVRKIFGLGLQDNVETQVKYSLYKRQ